MKWLIDLFRKPNARRTAQEKLDEAIMEQVSCEYLLEHYQNRSTLLVLRIERLQDYLKQTSNIERFPQHERARNER
jgi:hypothetical protein